MADSLPCAAPAAPSGTVLGGVPGETGRPAEAENNPVTKSKALRKPDMAGKAHRHL